MLVTLNGADKTMDDADGDIFSETLMEVLQKVANENGISLGGIDLGEQTIAVRRDLEEEPDDEDFYSNYEGQRRMGMAVSNVTQRILPSGSSALDVSLVITGDYRPPPYLDLNVIAEDSINRDGDQVVSTLRERGSRAGRDFFDRVDGIKATAKDKVTERPTKVRPTPISHHISKSLLKLSEIYISLTQYSTMAPLTNDSFFISPTFLKCN